MAEVYASHLATALSYAQALDGAGDGTAASPSLPTPAGAVVSAPLSVGALAARAGSCTPSLLSVLGPSEALGTGGMASVRSSSSALRTGGPLSSMRALAPLSSAAGGHRDADASFFGAEAAPHMHPQSQLEEIKRQLQDIHRSTRRALSDMQQDGPTPATAAAAAGGVYTPAAAGGTGLLNTSASGFLGGGAGDVSLLDAPPSVASAGPARSVRGKGGSAMNRSLDALAARHHRNHLHQQAGDGGGGGDESILSAPPAVAAAAGAASSTASAAASAAGAAAGVSSTADLGERIRSMKAENQRLSQTLNVFLAREAVAGVRRND